jgi:glycosyltransferase involved in cell wall biosynthesis
MGNPENTDKPPSSDPHDAAFFEQMRGCRDNYRKLADCIHAVVGAQPSALDIGCGIGLQTARLNELGWSTIGGEYSPFAIDMIEPGVHVERFDLTEPIGSAADDARLLRGFHCVICTETAEHISEQHSLSIVANVASRATDVIVWSAAAPGQEWEGHINLQPPEYWLTRFRIHGWVLDEARTAQLRQLMEVHQAQHWMGRHNFCVLVPKEEPMHMTIVSTALNAERWIQKCISSVQSQTFRNYTHIVVDAKSEDRTEEIALFNAETDLQLQVVHNEVRQAALENCWHIWKNLPDSEVVVWLDGDDWLAHDRALEILALAYAHKSEPWLTYGQFMFSDGEVGFAAPYAPGTRVRYADWRATHLKTFRAGLAKRLSLGYLDAVATASEIPEPRCLLRPDGTWTEYAIDKAIMWPLLEMAGARYTCVYQILSVYNMQAASADRARNTPEHQFELSEVERLRALGQHALLKDRPW